MNHHCENAVFDLQNKVLKMPKYLFIENIKNIIMHTAYLHVVIFGKRIIKMCLRSACSIYLQL